MVLSRHTNFGRVLGLFALLAFVPSGERVKIKRMLPQPGLEPGTSLTGLIAIMK